MKIDKDSLNNFYDLFVSDAFLDIFLVPKDIDSYALN
jgi:hypothetical protein